MLHKRGFRTAPRAYPGLRKPADVTCARVALGELRPLHEEVVRKVDQDAARERERLHAGDRLDIHDGDVLDAEEPQLGAARGQRVEPLVEGAARRGAGSGA